MEQKEIKKYGSPIPLLPTMSLTISFHYLIENKKQIKKEQIIFRYDLFFIVGEIILLTHRPMTNLSFLPMPKYDNVPCHGN